MQSPKSSLSIACTWTGYFGLVKEFSGHQPRGHQESWPRGHHDEESENDEFFVFERYPRT